MRILIADDDPDIRALLGDLLARDGHEVAAAADGQEAIRLFFDRRPELVVLDVEMPGLDGWQVLERIREMSQTPVMMVTAQGQELDKVRGLRAGADDYVTKPFGRQELLARVEVLRRRAAAAPDAQAAPEAEQHGPLLVDHGQRRVVVDGAEVALTPLEFRLVAAFSRNPRQILSNEQIVGLVWDDAYTAPEQVKVLVGRVRRKLGDVLDAAVIETVRGFGYRFNPPAA